MKIALKVLTICALLASNAWGATYYVEDKGSASANMADQGSSAWTSAQNIGSPCSAKTAMVRAVAGDIVYFRGGTYSITATGTGGYKASLEPSNSGTSGSPITFIAYTGETPTIHCPTVTPGWYINSNIGTGTHNYIIWDGFNNTAGSDNSLVGGGYLGSEGGTTGSKFIRCTFGNAGSTITATDNVEAVRLTHATNCSIQHCTFVNIKQSTDYQNCTSIESYYGSSNTVENCYFYNCSNGIFLKSSNTGWTIRYNYFRGLNSCIRLWTNIYYANNTSIYHNIFVYTGNAIDVYAEEDTTTGNAIYNNTFYTTSAPDWEAVTFRSVGGHACSGSLFNNLIVAQAGTEGNNANVKIASATLSSLDYNLYYPLAFRSEGTVYTNFTTFKAITVGGLTSGNHDQHSVNASPTFTNGSGSMTLVGDFLLSGGSAGENAGSDGKDIGADVTLVGVNAGSEDTTPPEISTATIVSGSIR